MSGSRLAGDDDDYLDEEERRRESLRKQEDAVRRRLTPDWFTERRGELCLPPGGVRVAVVGGGFAGLMAAWYLDRCGVDVTVFEAASRIGGRVVTDRTFVRPHVIEAGAELIGENHPLWMLLATRLGLTLDPVTEYPDGRLRFRGRDVVGADRAAMETEVLELQRALGALAVTLSETEPWLDRRAAAWDAVSVASALGTLRGGRPPGPLARRWFEFTLGNDNCAPIDRQSFLGLLSSVSAARMGSTPRGMLGYWLSTETHRCRGGNDLLGTRLADGLTVRRETVVTQVQVRPSFRRAVAVVSELPPARGPELWGPGGRPGPRVERFDFAVLTAPPTVWAGIRFDPPFPAAPRMLVHGPAVKFLTRYPTRFWERQRPPEQFPAARADDVGSVWEGTDNQGPQRTPVDPDAGGGPYALSVFSGGGFVQAVGDYPAKLAALFPHGRPGPPPATLWCDWPTTPYVMTGYAVPARGQASTVFPAQLRPHEGALYFAGEQTSSGFFGYMEGALQSGARAARDIVQRVVVACPRGTRLARAVPGSPPDGAGG
ncbi:flavin monoamine oxidase family protein [Cellulomonas sp. 179-A 4D5 NHS]|uniref:flavin monoamine oxidase family protein n=1 Tax=Cellulomonas sp. 179-A 4D5 NHS TaxID=3142378 RepID=UPI00399FDEF6